MQICVPQTTFAMAPIRSLSCITASSNRVGRPLPSRTTALDALGPCSHGRLPMREDRLHEKRLCTAHHCEAEPFTDLPRDADD